MARTVQFRAVDRGVSECRSRCPQVRGGQQDEAMQAKRLVLQQVGGTEKKDFLLLQPLNSGAAGSHFEYDLAKTEEHDNRRFEGLVLQPRARPPCDQTVPR